ncbi:MAG: hypothetical protein Q7P63_14540 [Verrucomicrobiota bacterium JB022]|nr:hypothetical protein [Verrucomicrobiota bacterium JB022]
MFARSLLLGCLAGGLALPSFLQASTTQAVVDEGYAAFYLSELENFALSNFGTLETAPALTKVAELPGGRVWDAVRAPDGSFYAAVGSEGQVFHITPEGEAKEIFKAPQPLIRALALDDEGGLFIGVNPGGSIYRLPPGGERAELWTKTDATYVWDLRWDEDGLWIATGSPAALLHLPADAEVGAEPESWGKLDNPNASFTTLSRDEEGDFWLGSTPDGVVYYLHDPQAGYALYATDSAEVNHVLALGDGGGLFTTYRSGKKSDSSSSGSDANSLPPIVVTADDSLGESNAGTGDLYRITPSGFAQPIWRSGRSGINALSQIDDSLVLLGLSDGARLVALQDGNNWSLLHQVPGASEISVILPGNKASENFLFTSRPAGLWKIGGKSDAAAKLTSKVKDVRQIAQWSRVEVLRSQGLPLKVEVRIGDTAKPDSTWGAWLELEQESNDPTKAVYTLLESHFGRFFQYRIEVTDGTAKGEIFRVRAFYTLENVGPMLSGVEVLPFPIELQENVNRANANTDFDALFTARGLQTFVEGETQTRYKVNRLEAAGWYSVIWKAYDPNGDPLLHNVSLRRTGENEWQPLAQGLPDPYWSFPVKGLESGYYQVKIESRDGINDDAEPDPYRLAQARSRQFLIDNEPPQLKEVEREQEGNNVVIVVQAIDDWSPIADAFYNLDGSPYQPLMPEDGSFDSTKERFTLRFYDYAPGVYHTRVEVRDEAGQMAVLPLRFEIEEEE